MGLSSCETKVDATGRELLEHGSISFPVGCYHDDLQRESVPWHWHEELEAAIVTEGEAVIAIDSERYQVGAGGGFFINTGVLHGCWNVDDSACRFHSLAFHPRLVGGSFDSVFWHNYLQPMMGNAAFKGVIFDTAIDWHKEAIAAIEAAWQGCVQEKPGYEFAVRASLSQLIFQVSNHIGSTAGSLSVKSQRDEIRIKQMLQYIHEHCAEEVSLEQIAECAAISESECLRCFRKTIGTTPIQYLKSYRIQKAAELLRATQEKVVDIGVQCGFQDMSYFAKTFRAAYGCSPREFQMSERSLKSSVDK